MAPQVSVIIATYNRSRVLKSAIQRVVQSTFTDWELVVVGDCCTDDTPQVVASFSDPRIRFVNLEINYGEQSGPNNTGLELARGRIIAFLNHDDLYFPDYLAGAVEHLENTGSDLVWTAFAIPQPEAGDGAVHWSLGGVPRQEGYDPLVFVFASAWVFRRELAERVGAWRPAREIFSTPSQDWLFRAWRSGARIRFFPYVGLLTVPGLQRPNCYVEDTGSEQAGYLRSMQNHGFREDILRDAVLRAEQRRIRYRVDWRLLAKWMLNPVRDGLARFGIQPSAAEILLRTRRRGGLTDRVRRKQGLSDLA